MVEEQTSSIANPNQQDFPQPWKEGQARPFDSAYQKDVLEYLWLMRRELRLLAVRSAPAVRSQLLSLPLRIVNRGRLEVATFRGTVFVDIAFLDLLWLYSFEVGVADIKGDPYHLMEFTLTYAGALHAGKPFEQLDPYNSAALSEPQFRQLWHDAKRVQQIVFETTLAFVLAHEVGHIVLGHEADADRMFPDPASRLPDRATWALWRREAELAADRFAAHLCLDANVQPAQVLTWLDLVEIRRSFYGESAEYPTPGQRSATIQSVYAERFAADNIDMRTLPVVEPLLPDRDMSKVDRARNLENVRILRAWRRDFLFQLDGHVAVILKETRDPNLAAEFFLDQMQGYRRILQGANRPEALRAALERLEPSGLDRGDTRAEIFGLIEQAFTDREPAEIIIASLEREPLDVEWSRQLLMWAISGIPLYGFALDLLYLLSNTRFRWDPALFEGVLARLTEAERVRLKVQPYRLGVPSRPPAPSLEERIESLERWDGRYQEAHEATLRRVT